MTAPVGLFGKLMTSAFERGVTRSISRSGSSRNRSRAVHGTGTGTPPARVTHGA